MDDNSQVVDENKPLNDVLMSAEPNAPAPNPAPGSPVTNLTPKPVNNAPVDAPQTSGAPITPGSALSPNHATNFHGLGYGSTAPASSVDTTNMITDHPTVSIPVKIADSTPAGLAAALPAELPHGASEANARYEAAAPAISADHVGAVAAGLSPTNPVTSGPAFTLPQQNPMDVTAKSALGSLNPSEPTNSGSNVHHGGAQL